jgi:hypothetical protein
MREARIILPRTDNAGHSVYHVHMLLRTRLARTFGGYTATEVSGGWIDGNGKLYHDDSYAYDVAIPDGKPADIGYSVSMLRDIAIEAGKLAGQKSVYVRYPEGTVQIIDVPETVSQEVEHA